MVFVTKEDSSVKKGQMQSHLLGSFGSILLLGLATLFGCGKSETEDLDLDLGHDYFPLEVGREFVYQVDSIIFDEGPRGTIIDSVRTYFREVIAGTLLDNAGNIVFRVERFVREKPDSPWEIQKVWTAFRTEQQAFRTEDNLRFISLIFPPREGKSWDGTAFIDEFTNVDVAGDPVQVFLGWQSRLSAAGLPLTVGDFSFPETVTVDVADFETTIGIRRGYEQYARGVGLVFREWVVLDTQCRACCGDTSSPLCASLPWEEKAEHGFILRQQLVSFK